jgi:hypothetical protein
MIKTLLEDKTAKYVPRKKSEGDYFVNLPPLCCIYEIRRVAQKREKGEHLLIYRQMTLYGHCFIRK